ncbi:protein disulfide-isomerase precursor [Borealophlyctis nickersoniae]|nr:protein disulfide-isomerase precursor [Borealophlyctis nickersoniae]
MNAQGYTSPHLKLAGIKGGRHPEVCAPQFIPLTVLEQNSKMKTSILLALAACAAGHVNAEEAKESNVIVLSKALAPEYEIAATTLKDEIPLAKVDCTVETELCEEHSIQGFPTMKVFKDGKPYEYKGQRKADPIVSYMRKQALPAVTTLEADKLEEFANSDRVVVVGFFEADSAAHKAFAAVAEKLRDDYLFGYTSDKDAAKEHGATVPDVVLFKKFDDGKAEFDGEITEEALTSFVKTNSIPLMADIGPENYQEYVESGLPIAYLFVANQEDRKKYGALVEPLAKLYKGKVSFVYIDAAQYGGHGQNLNLKEKWPAFAIQKAKENLKYPFDQEKEMTAEAIGEFVKDFVAGKIQPSLKSQEIPESNDEPVKVVVGKNYEDIVMDADKDVFIEFYAPWCGHCKKLAPIWDQLATKVAGHKNIVIAKMDATENDLPADAGFRIEGFPTLKLFKGKTKEVVDYNGDRSVDDLVKFLESNTDFEVSSEEPVATETETVVSEEHDEL